MQILQLDVPVDQDITIVEQKFNNFFVDGMINQYLLLLGEFQIQEFNDSHEQTGFNDHPMWWGCWMVFLLTTLFTQIMMLNMLIAIMADTFDRMFEEKDYWALRIKVEMF